MMNAMIVGVQRSTVTFVSSSSTAPAIVSAKLRSLHSHRLLYQTHKQPPLRRPLKDDLVSGYSVYMATINLRDLSIETYLLHQIILQLLEEVLTHCGNIER